MRLGSLGLVVALAAISHGSGFNETRRLASEASDAPQTYLWNQCFGPATA